MSAAWLPASNSLRARALALLLLACGAMPPRKRARDQQADRAGLDLKRRVLEQLVALDPEPEDTERALAAIVDEFGAPTGPTRAVALSFLEEWRAACAAPALVSHLLGEALRESGRDGEGKRGEPHHP